MKRLALTFFLFSFLTPAFSQFIEESELQGIFIVQEGTMWGNGASFFDYNHDGWDDLTTADGTDFVRFYKNDGTGNLIEDDINLNFAFSGQIISVLWFDCENDGDEDLLVTQFGGRALIFENNGNFQFTETAISKGLQTGSYLYYGAAIADYDQDGFLDICLPKYYNPDVQQIPEYSTRLLHNDGDGTFTDVTVPANVLMPPRPCFQIVFFDYNEDGWLDMYWIIDRASWIN
ncbi:MAG: FG-GAP repeat domain-containing protein, partial [Flavobacteriales bacterium]